MEYHHQSRKDSIESPALSHKTIDFWEIIEKKANEFLDLAHVHKGDPLIKQDKFFAKNKLLVLKMRKSSTYSVDSSITLKLKYKKKMSCNEFEKEEISHNKTDILRSIKSEDMML